MAGIKCSVNGKNFKDFGIYVSKYDGLFDALKRKKVNSYDWTEYHGESLDLSNPKFEAREISLKCFVVGDNWLQMKTNFDTVVLEFQKAGTQRLLIEPFGEKPLPYEVFLYEDVNLNKDFNEGKMVGVFTLKLIEPNPIKTVFVTDLDIVNLSFLSGDESEIFWGDGTKNVFSGNCTVTKDFHFPSYDASGYSIAYTSTENPLYFQIETVNPRATSYEFSVGINNLSNATLYVLGRNKITEVYEVIAVSIPIAEPKNILKVVEKVKLSNYGKLFFKVLVDGLEVPGIELTNPRIEKAEMLGEWINMVGKTKYIVIAGNIEQLENVSSNAVELWTKL